MQINDPAGTLGVQQAIFLGGDEVLVELGDHVYLADITTKRVGPVMQGEKFITFRERSPSELISEVAPALSAVAK